MMSEITGINPLISFSKARQPYTTAANTKQNISEVQDSVTVDDVINSLRQMGIPFVSAKTLPQEGRSDNKWNGMVRGHGGLTIAPNILQKMADDPEMFKKYSAIIQKGHSDITNQAASRKAMGFHVHGYGSVIHEDGTIGGWIIIENKICPHAERRDKKRAEKRLKAEAAKRRELQEIQDKRAEEMRAHASKDLDSKNMSKVILAYNKNSVFLPTTVVATADVLTLT